MRLLPESSVDTVITDPPYGLKFMGKKWDYNVPSVEVFEEMMRVTKPGGTLLCFAGSRTQHRMAVNLEDAGWIIKDTIMWLYGSGFPKATDISKQLDKGSEKKLDGVDPIRQAQLAQQLKSEAKLWNGWKSHGLKPAYEPIIVAMKPNDGTYANNALKHGVSGLNIDGGRIEADKEYKEFGSHSHKQSPSKDILKIPNKVMRSDPNTQGRFPANIILDEEAGAMLDEQSGVLVSKWGKAGKGKQNGGFLNGGYDNPRAAAFIGDKGGASRFFYCAKASKKERDAGLENSFEEQKWVQYQTANGTSGKASSISEGRKTAYRNIHPTVKPLKLMEYLCTLTKTPTGGLVLDPYMGSGTTGIACKNTGRDFIGIEMDEEYFKIAKARIL